MAHALQIDTLAFTKKLREAGAEEGLAEAIVEGLTAADTSELATKSDVAKVESALKVDIAEVKGELKADIAEVRTEIAEVKAELKQDIAEVKVEIAEVKSDLTTLIMQSSNRTIYIIGGLIGLLFAIDKLLPLAGLE